MPIKIQIENETPEERIAALRLKIKPGEGLTLNEIADAVGRSIAQVSKICRSNGWLVKHFSIEKRNYVNLLVNPKTLALCRKK